MAFLDSAMGGRIFGTAPLHRAADIGGGEGHGEGADPLQPRRLSLSGRKVLIVEDEFFVGLELAQALETAGAGIVGPAWSLADAKRLAESEEFDMAVVDVNMNENTRSISRSNSRTAASGWSSQPPIRTIYVSSGKTPPPFRASASRPRHARCCAPCCRTPETAGTPEKPKRIRATRHAERRKEKKRK